MQLLLNMIILLQAFEMFKYKLNAKNSHKIYIIQESQVCGVNCSKYSLEHL